MPSPGKVHLHFVFCTKYRLPFLLPGIVELVERYLNLKATEFGSVITAMSILPDHVHLLIEVPHTQKVSDIAREMKGRSSYEARKAFPWLKQCKALWQKRYFCCSVGPRSTTRVRRYLNSQKGE